MEDEFIRGEVLAHSPRKEGVYRHPVLVPVFWGWEARIPSSKKAHTQSLKRVRDKEL